jgi:glycosyltransferase involved in cell wall biosynthesis
MRQYLKKIERDSLVSIIINCYNGEKYLSEAIDSVIKQTYQNWEIIFWDNQSNDNSKKIFHSYEDKRLNYFYAPSHTRLYEARNYALEKANGEFIAFLDVDDWWEANKLEKQLILFDDQDVALVYSNFWIANCSNKKTRLAFKKNLPSGYVLDEMLSNYPVGMLTIIVRQKSLKSLDYNFDSRFQMIGDFDLTIRLSVNSKFSSVQEPLAYYRIHDNNMSKKHRKLQNLEIEKWLLETSHNKDISNKRGFMDRQKLLLYFKGIEAIQSHKILDAFYYILKVPYKLKLKLFLLIVIPRKILNVFGRG